MAEFAPISGDDWNIFELNREMDKTKSRVFMGDNHAAFFGSLMCQITFIWTVEFPTAATDGLRMYWNPKFFLALDEKTRETILMHELDHVAKLHMVRKEDRDGRIWNYACDYHINNNLKRDGYYMDGFSYLLDNRFPYDMPEEEIYHILTNEPSLPNMPWGDDEGDMRGSGSPGDDTLTEEQLREIIDAVITANETAKMSGEEAPNLVQQKMKQFLAPKVDWETELFEFMNDIMESGTRTFRKPNRRFSDIIVPGLDEDDGRLQRLNWYFDVSGSVTDSQVIRCMSEIKYIKENFNPKHMTLAQFDTSITDVQEFTEEDEFDELVVVGRGGTCLICVRDHIIETNPTAVVVFSDLYCAPMEPLPVDIPIIWIALDNRQATVPSGKIVHLRS